LRERVIIIGILQEYIDSDIIEVDISRAKRNATSAISIMEMDTNVDDYRISDYEERILNAWAEFITGVEPKVIGFPIWLDSMFGNIDLNSLPEWKQKFINLNKDFYLRNKIFIDKWYLKHSKLDWAKPTDRKFEWQAGEGINNLWEGIIQFRPSGIRVKQPTEFPALVAMVHIPIIGWEKRRLTPREAANLQSFPNDFKINKIDKSAYKQFGNAVNTDVIYETVNHVLNKYSISL
jgi:DNA (cytosine-5)-methyltransferase 1